MRFRTKRHRYEARIQRNYCGGIAHLVHYSGRMHTFSIGPVSFVFSRFANRT